MQGGDPTGTGRGGESIYGFVAILLSLWTSMGFRVLCKFSRGSYFLFCLSLGFAN